MMLAMVSRSPVIPSSILAVVAWVTWEKLWAMHGSLEFRKVSTHVGQEVMDRGAEVLGQDTNKVWSR